MKKIFTSLLVSFLTISITPVFAQEALKSVEEDIRLQTSLHRLGANYLMLTVRFVPYWHESHPESFLRLNEGLELVDSLMSETVAHPE